MNMLDGLRDAATRLEKRMVELRGEGLHETMNQPPDEQARRAGRLV